MRKILEKIRNINNSFPSVELNTRLAFIVCATVSQWNFKIYMHNNFIQIPTLMFFYYYYLVQNYRHLVHTLFYFIIISNFLIISYILITLLFLYKQLIPIIRKYNFYLCIIYKISLRSNVICASVYIILYLTVLHITIYT